MNRRFGWLAAAVAVAVVALAAGAYFGQSYFAGRAAPAAPNAVSTLPAVSLPDERGTAQSLDQWRGKVVIVNFWATWCAPCRDEMPEFVRIQSELGAKGLQFVGIAVDQQEKVEPFIREIGLNYPALIGGYDAMELSRTLGNRVMALPFTVIVGRNGTIAHRQLGPLREQKLRQLVDPLL